MCTIFIRNLFTFTSSSSIDFGSSSIFAIKYSTVLVYVVVARFDGESGNDIVSDSVLSFILLSCFVAEFELEFVEEAVSKCRGMVGSIVIWTRLI